MYGTEIMFKETCLQFLNIPYKWGGANPLEGMDCSGLAQVILAQYGVDPKGDQTAQHLYDWVLLAGRGSSTDTGALAFYGKNVERISHVAIHIDRHQVLEAGGGGSKTQTLEDAIKQSAYIRVRPRAQRKDYLGSFMPPYPVWTGL